VAKGTKITKKILLSNQQTFLQKLTYKPSFFSFAPFATFA